MEGICIIAGFVSMFTFCCKKVDEQFVEDQAYFNAHYKKLKEEEAATTLRNRENELFRRMEYRILELEDKLNKVK